MLLCLDAPSWRRLRIGWVWVVGGWAGSESSVVAAKYIPSTATQPTRGLITTCSPRLQLIAVIYTSRNNINTWETTDYLQKGKRWTPLNCSCDWLNALMTSLARCQLPAAPRGGGKKEGAARWGPSWHRWFPGSSAGFVLANLRKTIRET